MNRLSLRAHDLPRPVGTEDSSASRPDCLPGFRKHRGAAVYAAIVLAGVIATVLAGTGVDRAFFAWIAGG